ATPAAPAAAPRPLAQVITALLDKGPSRRPNAARVRALLEGAANPPAPPPPTQVVQVPVPGSGGKGVRLGRKTLIGLGAAVVAGAVAAYPVIADPFAGPLPDGRKTREEQDLGVSVEVPQDYQRSVPGERSRVTDHWVRYTDWSGRVWVGRNLDKKAEDTGNNIAGSAD